MRKLSGKPVTPVYLKNSMPFYFFRQLTVYVQDKMLPITGFEPRTSGIESDRSTNWATNTAQELHA